MQKELMISNIRRQRELLDDLISGLEKKDVYHDSDYQLCETVLETIEKDLGRIRRKSSRMRLDMNASGYFQISKFINRLINL